MKMHNVTIIATAVADLVVIAFLEHDLITDHQAEGAIIAIIVVGGSITQYFIKKGE